MKEEMKNFMWWKMDNHLWNWPYLDIDEQRPNSCDDDTLDNMRNDENELVEEPH